MTRLTLLRPSLLLGAALFLGVLNAGAAPPSPVGRWRTIDEATNQPRSIVRLELHDGVLEGTIEKVFLRPGEQDRCKDCTGDRKNQPITGMKFLWGLRADGDEYAGGEVLDPGNGRIYRCYLKVAPDGQTIAVRGYLGISLFGRTQTWVREP